MKEFEVKQGTHIVLKVSDVEQLENATTDPYHWELRIFAITPDIEFGRD